MSGRQSGKGFPPFHFGFDGEASRERYSPETQDRVPRTVHLQIGSETEPPPSSSTARSRRSHSCVSRSVSLSFPHQVAKAFQSFFGRLSIDRGLTSSLPRSFSR